MKLPGPDHPITIAPNAKRVRVIFGDKVIADTTRALTLQRGGLSRRFNTSRALTPTWTCSSRTAHAATAPTRATPAISRSPPAARRAENAVWSYEQPFPAMAEIAGYLAFYPNRVDTIEEI